MKECHKCPFNGKGNSVCIECAAESQAEHTDRKTVRFFDWYQPLQPDTEGSEKVTQFDDNTEDALRKALYTLLDLAPNELLLIKAIHEGKTLTQFADDMENLAAENSKFSRFRAFQTRKSIVKKMPKLGAALLTAGQRKQLKKD